MPVKEVKEFREDSSQKLSEGSGKSDVSYLLSTG
jgi:hypothetical protein